MSKCALSPIIFLKNSCRKICTIQQKAVTLHRFYGDSLAQLVEHIPFKDGVVGSNPTRITKGSSPEQGVDSFFVSIPIYHSTTYIL